MTPLVGQLSVGFPDPPPKFRSTDFRSVEGVAPPATLRKNDSQVVGHCGGRLGDFPETQQLRMVAVSFRKTLQDFLSQQSFAPQSYQSFGIQISRVDCPQSHDRRNLIKGR